MIAGNTYFEQRKLWGVEVHAFATSFYQGNRERHAVTVYSFSDSEADRDVYMDALLPYPSTDVQAIRVCIRSSDECIAQIERMQPQPAPIDTTDTNEPPF